MRTLDVICLILVVVGGLNWLLVGLFEFDFVATIFGSQLAMLSRVVYVLVGLAAIWVAFAIPRLVPSHRAPPPA